MCDIKEALSRMFTPAGTGGTQALFANAQQQTLQLQQTAEREAAIAAAGPASNQAARDASEARMRLLLAATGGSATFAGGAALTPNIGTKTLTGA